MVEVAGVIIYGDKAYLHVEARIKGNGFLAVEPVFVADLTTSSLTAAFEQVIAAGHPLIRAPSSLEMKFRTDPILKASGAKNWDELARHGAGYTITWHQNKITLYISKLDQKGRFISDPIKTKTFPIETPVSQLVDVILADARSRKKLDLTEKQD